LDCGGVVTIALALMADFLFLPLIPHPTYALEKSHFETYHTQFETQLSGNI